MTTNIRYFDWLAQAQNDFLCAGDTLKSKHYAQCCFICQQGGEKASKALAYFGGADIVKGHSITSIFSNLKVNGELEKAGKFLDRFYISARYPDAYPSGFPAQYIELEDAEKAIKMLEKILTFVSDKINET